MRGRAGWLGAALFATGVAVGSFLRAPTSAHAEPSEPWQVRLVPGLLAADEAERKASVAALATAGVPAMPTWLPALASAPADDARRGLLELILALPRSEAEGTRAAVRVHLPSALARLRPALARRQREAQAETVLQPLLRDGAIGDDFCDEQMDELERTLGRDALPALVAALQRAELDGEVDHWDVATACAEVATLDDIPLLLPLIETGSADALLAFEELRSTTIAAALVRGIESGRMSKGMLEALEPYEAQPEVRAAVLRWFQRPHAADHIDVDVVGEWLATRRVEGTAEAIRAVLKAEPMAWNRVVLGLWLVKLGHADGFQRVLDDLPELASDVVKARQIGSLSMDIWASVNAAFADAGAPSGAPGTGKLDDPVRRTSQLRAWWNDARSRLSYEPDAGRWVLGPPR